MNKDIIRYASNSLKDRKMRSFLTTLSVLIGIMAVFTLISFGQGLSKYASDFSNKMGADKIILQPKSAGAVPDKAYSKEDVDYVKKIKGIKQVAEMPIESIQVQRSEGGETKYTLAMASSTDFETQKLVEELMTVELLKGRQLKKGDKLKAVAGYGYTQPNQIFEKPINVGDKLLINNKEVRIIGFYEAIGNPQDDSQIYFTLEGMKELTGKDNTFSWMLIRADASENPTILAEKIKDKFRKHLGEEKGKEDFEVQTFEDMIASFKTILTVINGVLIVIALISVLISAINIMNTMYTSVLERTKDIGIMKAIGARNNDIRTIFLIESGILGLLGGIIGIILGWMVSSLGGFIAASAGYELLKPYFTLELVLGCLIFSTAVGALSGLAPAIQASKHKPVESLRYE